MCWVDQAEGGIGRLYGKGNKKRIPKKHNSHSSENWGALFLEERMSTDARIWKSRKLMVVGAALLGALSAGCEGRVASAPAPPAPTVEVAPVIEKDVPLEGDWVRPLQAYANPQISP